MIYDYEEAMSKILQKPELKRFSVSNFKINETRNGFAYFFELMFDGKSVGFVSNYGTGEPDIIRFHSKGTEAEKIFYFIGRGHGLNEPDGAAVDAVLRQAGL